MYFVSKKLNEDLKSCLEELQLSSPKIFKITMIESPTDLFSKDSIEVVSKIFKNYLLSLSFDEFLNDKQGLLSDHKLTLRLRPGLNKHHIGNFEPHLFRTYNHKFLSNIQDQLQRLEGKPWDRFSLTLEIDEENVQLLYASIVALDGPKMPLHFFVKIEPKLINNQDFIRKLRSQFSLLETYLCNKPFIYFYPNHSDQDLWDALVENSFRGPERLEIDISNTCTHNCIFCATYNDENINKSIDENGKLSRVMQDFIDSKISKENFYGILNQAPLGIDVVTLGGVGDPFIHPNIMDFIEEIRMKGLSVTIYTNYAYMTPKRIEKLHSLTNKTPHGIRLILNISGGSLETYLKTRPNQREADFLKLKENLTYSNQLYKRDGHGVDMVVMCVVNKQNAFDLPSLVDFANETGISTVWFKPMELHEKSLLKHIIKKESFENYFASMYKAYLKAKKQGIKIHDEIIMLSELKEIKNKIPNASNLKNLKLQKDMEKSVQSDQPGFGYEITEIESLRWNYFTDLSEKLCHPKRDQHELNNLSYLQEVESHKEEGAVQMEVRNGSLATQFFSTLPCHIASNYIRFSVEGDISPCCISNFPTGKINESHNFRSAWFSSNMYAFRNKLKNIHRDKFHLTDEAWSFCQQCCHLTENIKYNLKRGFKLKETSKGNK